MFDNTNFLSLARQCFHAVTYIYYRTNDGQSKEEVS